MKKYLFGITVLVPIAMSSFTAPQAYAAEGSVYAVTNVVAGQNPSADRMFFASFKLEQDGHSLNAGTLVHILISSCGADIATSDTYFDGTTPGAFVDMSEDSVNDGIGPSFEYVIDIAEPGAAVPSRLSGSNSSYTVRRPSCEEILSGKDASITKSNCQVDRWSTKKALPGVNKRAVTGHKVKIAKTVAPGCVITYIWKANGKKVGVGTSLRVTDAFKGKTLTNVITASNGKTKKTKTLSYGRATSR